MQYNQPHPKAGSSRKCYQPFLFSKLIVKNLSTKLKVVIRSLLTGNLKGACLQERRLARVSTYNKWGTNRQTTVTQVPWVNTNSIHVLHMSYIFILTLYISYTTLTRLSKGQNNTYQSE